MAEAISATHQASRIGGLGKKEPARYTLHFQHYGGFDVSPLDPLAALEDRQTGELIAIHPCSHQALEMCKQAGVEIVDERSRSKRNAEIRDHTGGTS